MYISRFCGFLLLFFTSLLKDVLSVKITNFNVPRHHVIKNSANPETLVLDCEYEIDPKETQLVVKWLLNHQPIYQWIHGRTPHAMSHMKDKIDLTYQASNDDMQKYRAMALINPTWNSTGKYECSVQTFESIDIQSGFLQIIDFSQAKWNISHKILNDDDLQVNCSVQDVFPQPKLSISLQKGEYIPIKSENFQRDNDGLFDVSVSGTIKNENFDDNTELTCSLMIPDTDFTIEQTESYSGNSTSDSASLSTTSVIFLLSYILSNLI